MDTLPEENCPCPCPGFWVVFASVAAGLTALGMLGNLFINYIQIVQARSLSKHAKLLVDTESVLAEPVILGTPATIPASPYLVRTPQNTDTAFPILRPLADVVQPVVVVHKQDHEHIVRDLLAEIFRDRVSELQKTLERHENEINRLGTWRAVHQAQATERALHHGITSGFELRRRDVQSG